MKIGDKVRFLSETGGGKVAGFQGKNIVLVEDEDGFEIPTAITDVVVVETDDYSSSRVVANKMGEKTAAASPAFGADGRSIKAMMQAGQDEEVDTTVDELEPADKEITFKAAPEERVGGNKLSCYLAFVPIDVQNLSNTRFECYLVNDSNYCLAYSYLSAEGASWSLKHHGEIEPNTKEFVEEFGFEDLNSLGHVAIQLLAYKREKPFILKPTVDAQFRIDQIKFFKRHAYEETDFFEQPAMLYTIVENDKVVRPLVIDAKALKSDMYRQPQPQAKGAEAAAQSVGDYVRRYEDGEKKGNPFIIKHRGDDELVVVDLHIDELLDSTKGMSNSDILDYQLKVFRETLEKYRDKRGQKLVFIHGKGEGVLRRAIISDLNYRYKKYQYQDASFQEYGYGATQVTIK